MKFAGDHRQGPQTRRLQLRAFEDTDAEAFFRLNSNPQVIRYTGEAPCESIASAREGIRTHPDWPLYGIGRWAVIDKISGEVIGFAGLKCLTDLNEVDLGYRFLPQYWGRGLATEASIACVAYGFDELGLGRIIGITLPQNGASMRVLEKVGMVRQEPILYEGEPAELFVIDRESYGARHNALEGP